MSVEIEATSGSSLRRAENVFAEEKPRSWATRQLAEAIALSNLGICELAEWRFPGCRGVDDEDGTRHHLASARALAGATELAAIDAAVKATHDYTGMPPISLAVAMERHFALKVSFDLREAARELLDVAAGTLHRRLERPSFGESPIVALRAMPPLTARSASSDFDLLVESATRTVAMTDGLADPELKIVHGGAVASRMWRRWFAVGDVVHCVVDEGAVDPAPQDVAWRLVHDAAHLAHLGDLCARKDQRVRRIGDAPYILIAEGYAMLSEARLLGLAGASEIDLPAEVAPELIELEALLGVTERAVRFIAEAEGDYRPAAIASLASRSGLPFEAVATSVFEWRGLTGMGSCYILGLLTAIKAWQSGQLLDLLRFEIDPPALAWSDVEELLEAIANLADSPFQTERGFVAARKETE